MLFLGGVAGDDSGLYHSPSAVKPASVRSMIARGFPGAAVVKAPWISWPTELCISGCSAVAKSARKRASFFAFALDSLGAQRYDSRLSLKATQKCKLFDNRSG